MLNIVTKLVEESVRETAIITSRNHLLVIVKERRILFLQSFVSSFEVI